MNESDDALDPDEPIPYVLTDFGRAPLILDRIASWRNEELAKLEYRYFTRLCEKRFTPEQMESIFG